MITVILNKKNPDKNYTELNQRIKSWWVMVAVFSTAIMIGRTMSIVFFGLVCYLALKEYLSLIETRRADRRILFWVYLAIPIQFLWIGYEWYGMFIIWIPVFMFLFLPLRMTLKGEVTGFLQAMGTLHWGLMITVFCLSHIAYLLVLPVEHNPNGGGAALVLFLVFLTQLNDVAQYIWGKSFGKHKVLPTVSPGKTYEGLLGGIFTTTLASTALGGFLTPMSVYHSVIAGLIISLAGFIGDVNISALKRDIGVKDSGNLLPGHGGILDRVDSISFTAPLFFHFIYYLYYPLPI
ncbi:phosphatidate cytidylyltransferase [Oligoflexaceae bacterium]|nr:phosphatidate cytidylyltransferase [Oligoflexaceae bacterium]